MERHYIGAGLIFTAIATVRIVMGLITLSACPKGHLEGHWLTLYLLGKVYLLHDSTKKQENLIIDVQSNGLATSTGYADRGRLPALAVDVAIP